LWRPNTPPSTADTKHVDEKETFSNVKKVLTGVRSGTPNVLTGVTIGAELRHLQDACDTCNEKKVSDD